MADTDTDRTFEFTDRWLWIVDSQYVHAPLGIDTLDPEESRRGIESPVLTHAVILNSEGKTDDALKEVAGAVESGQNAPELHWINGQLEFELGHYKESLKAYERVLEIRPKDKGATFNTALCLEKLGLTTEAMDRFHDVILLDPQLWAARIGLGGCLLELDQPDLALTEFLACLEQNPDHDRALIGKAASLHMLGKYDEALEIYTTALRLHPHDPDLLGNLVAVSAALKDEPRLRDYAEELLKAKPGARAALEGLVTAALLRGNFDVAAYYGAQYVQAVPDSYEGWFNQGVALQKTGLAQDAMNAYQQAIKVRSNGQEALANLAAILQENDDLEAARQAHERVLEVDPNHAGTLWNLGLLHQKSGNPEAAEKCFEQLVALKPEHADAWLRLGHLRLERGENAGAVEALEKIAKKPRARSDAQVNLAIAYWRCRQFDSARALLQKGLKESPNTVEFLRVLAVVAVEEGNAEDAAKLEAKLGQLGERMPELSYNVGVLLQNSGKNADAAKAFERATTAKPGFGEALLNLGHALKALGQEEKAQACWREAVESMPELAASYFGAGK